MGTLAKLSITYRTAVGRKVMTLQAPPAADPPFDGRAGQVSSCSPHAGLAAQADQRDKPERRCGAPVALL